MKLEFSHKGKNLTVSLQGELDHHNAKGIKEEIDMTASRIKPEVLIMDFAQVPFCDSSGIAVAIGRYKHMQSIGGRVKIINTSKQVKKVLVLSGVNKYVQID